MSRGERFPLWKEFRAVPEAGMIMAVKTHGALFAFLKNKEERWINEV